jgi:branched-chain amino acid transport system substrate-binding protein
MMMHPLRKTVAGLLATCLLVPSAMAQIRIGQTIDLSGGTAEHAKAVISGIKAYIDPLNAAGGVQGKRIEIITLDDGGKGDRAAQNTRELIEKQKVQAIFSGIEGGPCVASMKVAVELQVPLIGCAAGAPDMREPFNRFAFPVRAEHLSEFEVIVKLAKQFGRTRFAFIHADSDNGRRHLANLTRVAKAAGADVVAPIAMKSGAEALSPQQVAKEITAKGANAVLNHGGYSTYAEIFRATRAVDPGVQFYAVNSGAQQMVRLLGDAASGIVFTQVVPLPSGAVLPLLKEYRAALKKQAPDEEPSFSSLEGYINARVLVAGLRKAGGNQTPEGLINALESSGDIDIGGFRVRYSKTAHTGSTFVDTVVARKDGRFRSH